MFFGCPARRVRLLLEEGLSRSHPSSQGASVPSYLAAGRRVSVSADGGGLPAGVTVAVRLSDLVTPLKSGVRVTAGNRSALAVAGTGGVPTGRRAGVFEG